MQVSFCLPEGNCCSLWDKAQLCLTGVLGQHPASILSQTIVPVMIHHCGFEMIMAQMASALACTTSAHTAV